MAYNLTNHLLFNHWANVQVAETIRLITDEDFVSEGKSSFPSISKTVAHMWGAQYIWLRRMHGESIRNAPMSTMQLTKDEALDGLIKSSHDFIDFVKSKDGEFLASRYRYNNLKGEPFEDSYEDTLFHVVNHSTYHRGQLINMLRDLGITSLPGTDLIHFLRKLHREN
jgi:uncharacterized damage-inducible protein DinB